jgi:hypothetical protein
MARPACRPPARWTSPVHRNGPLSSSRPTNMLCSTVGCLAEFLVDHHDPAHLGIVHGGARRLLARDEDPARGRWLVAGKDLHRGGLAGPILVDQGMDLAREEVDLHAAKRLDRAEGLRDVATRKVRDHSETQVASRFEEATQAATKRMPANPASIPGRSPASSGMLAPAWAARIATAAPV